MSERPARRGPRRGLRLQIAAVIAGIVLVAVTGLGIAVHLLLVKARLDEARSSADGRMRAAMQIYRMTGLLSFDAKLDNGAVPTELQDAVDRNGSRATLVSGGGTRTVWVAGRVDGRVLSIRTRFTVVDATLRSTDRFLVIAGAVTVVVASLVGVASSGRLVRRLRVAARTARGVAGGDDPRSLRAAVGARSDEVGDLADAVDAMADQLNKQLRLEQRLTADVAHDLRTPVTGLVAAAALLDDSRPAEMVRDRARALTTLVEDLLEVARLDHGSETADLEYVDLGDVVARAVGRGVASGEFPEGQVVVGPASGPTRLLTDRRRLERVLSNLVRNGLQHGAAPVEVSQEGRLVRVRDHGPGFEPRMLDDGPQRFRRGSRRSGGNGLGLVIARGQAAVLGATLDLTNVEGGGACVTVALPDTAPDVPHDQVTDASRDRDPTGSWS